MLGDRALDAACEAQHHLHRESATLQHPDGRSGGCGHAFTRKLRHNVATGGTELTLGTGIANSFSRHMHRERTRLCFVARARHRAVNRTDRVRGGLW